MMKAGEYLPAVPRLPPMDVPLTIVTADGPAGSPTMEPASNKLDGASSSFLLPPSPLRKSISVDSFIRRALASPRRSTSPAPTAIAWEPSRQPPPPGVQHAPLSTPASRQATRAVPSSYRPHGSSAALYSGSLLAMNSRDRADSFQSDLGSYTSEPPSAGQLKLPRRSMHNAFAKRDSRDKLNANVDPTDPLRISIPSSRDRSGSLASFVSNSSRSHRNGRALPSVECYHVVISSFHANRHTPCMHSKRAPWKTPMSTLPSLAPSHVESLL